MKCLEPQNCWIAEAAWIKRRVKDKNFLSSSDHISPKQERKLLQDAKCRSSLSPHDQKAFSFNNIDFPFRKKFYKMLQIR